MGTSVACSGETKWFWRVANCKSWFKEGSGCGCFTCCCFICIAHSRFLQTMKIKSLWVDSVRKSPIKWPCNVNLNFVVTAEHPQNGELLEDPDTIGTTGWIFQSTFTLTNHNLECSWICWIFCACVCVCVLFSQIFNAQICPIVFGAVYGFVIRNVRVATMQTDPSRSLQGANQQMRHPKQIVLLRLVPLLLYFLHCTANLPECTNKEPPNLLVQVVIQNDK